MLYQTGYLTIGKYKNGLFTLCVPDEEVRQDLSALMSQIQRKKYAAPYRAADKPVWAVALSFKSRGRKFAGGHAVPVK